MSPVIVNYRDEATGGTLEAYKGHLRGILAFFKTLRSFSKYKSLYCNPICFWVTFLFILDVVEWINKGFIYLNKSYQDLLRFL